MVAVLLTQSLDQQHSRQKNSGYVSRRDINFVMTITSDCLLSYHWAEAK